MTTILSLNEDLFYTILSKCSSSIDMWHLLLALHYEVPQMVNLQAFWSRVRLTSLHNHNVLFSFVKEIAHYCVDLRLNNLDWMTTADLRRLLSPFRLLVCLHTGNVALSRSTLVKDIRTFFPFLKYLTVLISLDANVFPDFSASLNQIHQLEHISMVLQDNKDGCLSDPNLQQYLRFIPEYISNTNDGYKLISIEENRYGLKHRFRSSDIPNQNLLQPINLSLISTLRHLIISFRPISNVNLTLELKDPTVKKLPLQTLVLPCVPVTSASMDILDLSQLTILDIGYIDVMNRPEIARLDEFLVSHFLRNLTICLSAWQPTRLVGLSVKEDNQKTTSQFTSVFENCFDQISTPENEIEKPILIHSANQIEAFSLQFIDSAQATVFQLPLHSSWLNKLTNLNLTGIHCHSTDFQHIFDSLHLLRSLSLSPCLLFHIDQSKCHCQSRSTSLPYQIHSLNRRLLSLNLVSHLLNPKDSCPILLDQYKLHCIRHSSIHQHFNTNELSFQYDYLIRYSIRTIFQTLDLHHLSIRIPAYPLHIEDLDIPHSNHLQSLVLDVKTPLTLHTKLAQLYLKDRFSDLRRFILISGNGFELTPILIDRFRTLELVEIISIKGHLNRSTINYLETVLKPNNYPSLTTFRLLMGTVDAEHLLKHAHKTIRTAFKKIKPGFLFDISLFNVTRQCSLYDQTHELQQDFHSLLSIHSNQLSIVYPSFLNYKPSYSAQQFDK